MELNRIMEFDHPIRVMPDGSVVDHVPNVHAPDVLCTGSDVSCGRELDVYVSEGWSLLSGYSGQYGYAGPVMHPSEFIGGDMERDILATPGVYVAVTVEHLDGEDSGPCGWAVAYVHD